jgi:hypothetical protein
MEFKVSASTRDDELYHNPEYNNLSNHCCIPDYDTVQHPNYNLSQSGIQQFTAMIT